MDVENIGDIIEKLKRAKIDREHGILTQEEYNRRIDKLYEDARDIKETLKGPDLIFKDIIGKVIRRLEKFKIDRDSGALT